MELSTEAVEAPVTSMQAPIASVETSMEYGSFRESY